MKTGLSVWLKITVLKA